MLPECVLTLRNLQSHTLMPQCRGRNEQRGHAPLTKPDPSGH